MAAPKAGKNYLAEVANKPANWYLSPSRSGSEGGPSASPAAAAAPAPAPAPAAVAYPPLPALARAPAAIGSPAAAAGVVAPPVPALPRMAAAVGSPAPAPPAAAAGAAAPPAAGAASAAASAAPAAAVAPANLGAGGYGVILSPALNDEEGGVVQKFPQNVSKVFFTKRKFDAALEHLRKVPEVMGVNEGHRFHTYKKAYKGSNLPVAMQTKYKLKPDDPLYLIRMPNLGKDIGNMTEYLPMLRKVHIYNIVQQIVKVLGQVDQLQESGYVHGDIREKNVMVKPDGTLTIIDFDWLLPKAEFFERFLSGMGFYSTPPETLVYEKVIKRLDNFEHVKAWARRNARYYRHYFAARGMNERDIYNAVALTAYPEALEEIQYVHRGSYLDSLIPMLFPQMDTYAIATTLLEFLTTLYGPTILTRASNAAGIELFVNDLRALGVKIGDVDYSDAHLHFCAATLLGLTKVVLMPLADISVRRRIASGSFSGRYALAVEFGRTLYVRLTAPPPAPPPPPPPAAPSREFAYSRNDRYAGEVPISGNSNSSRANTNSFGGGGRRRRTLRRRHRK